MTAELPPALEDGEVIGLGVDVFLEGGDDSDYQLFADGGSDGWHAYFQTPRGFVAFPGSFAIGGRRIEFVVPWGSMGTPPRGEVRVFLDWSRARPVLNAAGSDYAPDRGRRAWAR